MKNYILVLIVICAFVPSVFADTMYGQYDYPYGNGFQLCCRNDDVSNTFMFTRPILDNTSTRRALWHNIFQEEDEGNYKCSFQVYGVVQQSLSLNQTKHYFLPGKCKRVLVAGDDVFQDLSTRQIRAEWIGLPSTFQGNFTIDPKQLQAGIVFEVNQDIGTLIPCSFFENSWINIAFPLTYVKNNMNICEDVFVTTPRTNCPCPYDNPTTIIQAFQQRDWHYAKIRSTHITETKLADIRLELGKTFLGRDNFTVAYSTILIIPTGNIQDPEFLFSPVAGNNGHFGIGTGVNFQFPITQAEEKNALCFFLDFESIFFARNRQWRTFDLKDKPYSRYLQFVRRDDPQGELIPGVNVLTRHVQVHPYNLADLSIGFRFKTEHAEIEVGYSIWGHGDEKIRILRDNNCCEIGKNDLCMYGIAGNPNTPNQKPAISCCQLVMPATASNSTISCQAANDVECAANNYIIIGECSGPLIDSDGDRQRIFVPITRDDIDLKSGASQSAFNHKFQIAIGCMTQYNCIDLFGGVGGYYDKPVKSGSLNLLGAWIKMGASF